MRKPNNITISKNPFGTKDYAERPLLVTIEFLDGYKYQSPYTRVEAMELLEKEIDNLLNK